MLALQVLTGINYFYQSVQGIGAGLIGFQGKGELLPKHYNDWMKTYAQKIGFENPSNIVLKRGLNNEPQGSFFSRKKVVSIFLPSYVNLDEPLKPEVKYQIAHQLSLIKSNYHLKMRFIPTIIGIGTTVFGTLFSPLGGIILGACLFKATQLIIDSAALRRARNEALKIDIEASAQAPFQDEEADVVIVGAGPVGLLTAIETRLRNTGAKIVILERYDRYKRDNPLNLNRDSFKKMSQDPRFQSIIDAFFGNNKTTRIKALQIETDLATFATSLDIHIIRGAEGNVQETQHLKDRFKKVKVIVAADGAKSLIRDKMGNQKTSQDLQFMIQVKYKVSAIPQRSNAIKMSTFQTSVGEHIIENIGTKSQEVFFLIETDRVHYEEIAEKVRIKHQKAKEEAKVNPDIKIPNAIQLEECSPELEEVINRVKILRRAHLGEREPETPMTEINAINLSVYANQRFHEIKDGVTYAWVGDSAFGVPYFRSLNNGIQCSMVLAETIAQTLHNPENVTNEFNHYENFVSRLSRYEIFAAKVKGFALRAFGAGIKLAGRPIPGFIRRFYWRYLETRAFQGY